MKMFEGIKMLFGSEPRQLVTDTMLCGKNGGKYNEKYYFVLDTDEASMILDRTNLKVMDAYSHIIKAINYLGIDLKQFDDRERTFQEQQRIQDGELVETMAGLM